MNENLEELANKIARKVSSCNTFYSSTLQNQYAENQRAYLRMPYNGDDKIKGRSKFITSDVQQRVEWATSQVVRILDSESNIVVFSPVTGSDYDIQLAKVQNATINHLLHSSTSHSVLLNNWLKTGFIFGLGIVHVSFEEITEESVPKSLKAVPDQQLAELVEAEENGEIEIIETGDEYRLPPTPEVLQQLLPLVQQTGVDISEIDPSTLPPEVMEILTPTVRDLKIRTITKRPQWTISTIDIENFIVSQNAKFDENTGGICSDIQGHRTYCSREELLERGYDKEDVERLPDANTSSNPVTMDREALTGQITIAKKGEVEIYEVYLKTKIDDKKARHYRVTLGGDLENAPIVLEYVEVSKTYPYAAFVPFLMPGTLFGQGVADRIKADQELISKMTRATVDNLQMVVDPIKIVNPDVTSIDDILNIHPGKVVRSEDPTGGIHYNQPQFAGQYSSPIIDGFRQNLDYSTGAGGSMVSLNASDFQDVTATASTQRLNANQMLIENVVKTFADTGYRYLVKIIIDLIITNPELGEQYIGRLFDGQPAIPPSDWDSEMDVEATVSFGTMDRDYRLSVLNGILGQQQQALQTGIATPQQIYKTLVEITEASGLKNAAAYFVDPSTLPPAPPPPPPVDPNKAIADAEILKAQLKAQADEKSREFDAYKLRVEDDFRRDELAQKLEIERAEIAARYGAQIDIARIEMEQARDRKDVEWAIEKQRLDTERQTAISQNKQMEQMLMEQQMAAQQQAQQMPPEMQMPEQMVPPMPPQEPFL